LSNYIDVIFIIVLVDSVSYMFLVTSVFFAVGTCVLMHFR